MDKIKLSSIIADENQPRKDFAADKMARLKSSIRKYGIKIPLVVEDMGNGKYLLQDGERRFRAAKDLKIEIVPVVIEKPNTKINRIVQQFHIQELKEGWSPTEKAMVVNELSEEMGISMVDICSLLEMPSTTVSRYLAFSKLINRDTFQKQNISIEFATYIETLKNKVRSIYQDRNMTFDRAVEKKLENAVIRRVSEGTIRNRTDITKIKDSFTSDYKTIEEFIEGDITPSEMYSTSEAQEAYEYRNIQNGARNFLVHINAYRGIDKKKVKVDEKTIKYMRSLRNVLDNLINSWE